MKNFPLWSLVLGVLSLFAAAMLHASPAVPPVFDTKNAPGSMCRISACSFTSTTIAQVHANALAATGGLITGIPAPNNGTDTCDAVCPIIRDRYLDPIGVRSAWIDVHMNLVSPAQPNRKITCRVYEETGVYPLSTTSGVVLVTQTGTGALASTPVPMTSDVQRLTLGIPTVPSQAAAAGASFANGGASIVCTIPWSSTVHRYGWSEYGGESTDY